MCVYTPRCGGHVCVAGIIGARQNLLCRALAVREVKAP